MVGSVSQAEILLAACGLIVLGGVLKALSNKFLVSKTCLQCVAWALFA